MLLGHKKSKFIIGQLFLQHSFFSLYQAFIETTTTDIDMFLHI